MKVYQTLILLAFVHLTFLSSGQPGQLDPEFGDGKGVIQFAIPNQKHTQGGHIALQPDGRLLVLGTSWTPNESEYAFLARFHTDGTTDSSLNHTGKIIFNPGNGQTFDGKVHVMEDGRILVSLRASTPDGEETHIHRLMPSGIPDASFHGDGFVSLSLPAAYMNLDVMALLPDGKMILGGYARFENNDIEHLTIVRLTANGELDPGFHGDGISSFPVGERYVDARSVLIQPDGKLIVAGYAVFGGEDDVILVRLLADGFVDYSFGLQGIVRQAISAQEDRCYAAALQPDGAIVLGCYAHNVISGETEFACARFLPNGTPDPGFDDDGIVTITISGHADGLRSMVLQPDGKIVLAGYVHSDIEGGSDMAVVRLNTSGTLDMTFDEDGIAILEMDANTSTTLHHITLQQDGRIVGTGRSRKDGFSSMYIARLLSGLTVSAHADQIKDMDFSVYPNPAKDQVHLSYTLNAPTEVGIELVDIQGRIISTDWPNYERMTGRNNEFLNLPHISPGIYVLSLVTDRGRTSVYLIRE